MILEKNKLKKLPVEQRLEFNNKLCMFSQQGHQQSRVLLHIPNFHVVHSIKSCKTINRSAVETRERAAIQEVNLGFIDELCSVCVFISLSILHDCCHQVSCSY